MKYNSDKWYIYTLTCVQETWEHEVYLDPQFAYHVSKDGQPHMVYQGNYDNLWHHDYYDTDPLFKLIKEKEELKNIKQRKVNKHGRKQQQNDSKGSSNGAQKTFNKNITSRQRYFLELLTRHFYKNGFIPHKSNFSSDAQVRIISSYIRMWLWVI